jgi:enoyl-[acyl-carrier protein] reductase I
MTNLLSGKRLLISGIVDGESISAAVAERAGEAGAETLLAAYPRDVSGAQEVAARCRGVVGVVEVDATREEDLAALEREVRMRWEHLDGVVHAIAFAPKTVLGGVMDVPAADVELAFRTSVWTYSAFAALLGRLAPLSGASLVGLDFDSVRAWPVYNWMGPCKAALRSLNSYLARDLGEAGSRANLVAAGPLRTTAASGIPDFEVLVESWAHQAPLRWDPTDGSVVADAVCFLLSDLARAITGEVLHVDGGFHAMATWLTGRDGGEHLGR